MTQGGGGVRQKMTDDKGNSFRWRGSIYFDKKWLKNIDLFGNPYIFGYFIYDKGTQSTKMNILCQKLCQTTPFIKNI